jgi:hypothetical protein
MDMSVAFKSNDTSCEPDKYYIDKVTDGNDANSTVEEADYLKIINIDEITGIVSITDTTNAFKWFVHLTASGKDGVVSGSSTVP